MTLIEETWRHLEQRVADMGLNSRDIVNMREAFVAAGYACSAAMVSEGATSRDISETIHRIEQRR